MGKVDEASAEQAPPPARREAGPIARVDEFFAGLGEDRLEDPLEIQARIMAEILEAPTLDEAFDVGKATPMESLFGVPLEVDAVKWQRSRYKEGFRYFAVCFGIRLDDSSRIVATTSAGNVVAFLRRAELRGELPVRFGVRARDAASEEGFTAHVVYKV